MTTPLQRRADGSIDTSRLRRADGSIDEAEFNRLSDLAFAEARGKATERDAHAAFHGRETLRYGRVERRPGYRGETRCLDCYYGRAWR